MVLPVGPHLRGPGEAVPSEPGQLGQTQRSVLPAAPHDPQPPQDVVGGRRERGRGPSSVVAALVAAAAPDSAAAVAWRSRKPNRQVSLTGDVKGRGPRATT